MHPVDTLLGTHAARPRAHRIVGLAASVAVWVFASAGVVAAGTTTIVECGQIVAYTAPDPVTPADGSLTIGLLPPWTIAPNAVIGGSAASVLPTFAGSGPSCIELELDVDDRVTALGFASEGSLTGEVAYDSGAGWYVFADRLLVPTFITDVYPGLAAVFATSAAEGTPVSATFTVDVDSGAFIGVDVMASFCGPATLDGDGNGLVGAAVIPAAVLDSDSTHALQRANGHRRCADVETEGTVGQELLLTTSVDISTPGPAASPPDTSAGAGPQRQKPDSGVPMWPVAGLVALALGVLVRRPAHSRAINAIGARR